MIETVLYFLRRTALAIPNNQYAKAIYNTFWNASINEGENGFKKADVDLSPNKQTLLNIVFDEKTTLEDKLPVNIERNKDYRFLYLYLNTFRKFPNNNDYYGISFCRVEDENFIPMSTILQGANGTGKTSLFGAMEYLFTQRMSAAEKQKQELQDYVPYVGKKIGDVDINVATKSLVFSCKSNSSQQQEIQNLCLLPFFCSERDVDNVIKDGLNSFVYKQMGYSLIWNIIEKIELELNNAIEQHGQREETIDSIQLRISELDVEIGMYEKLWSTFLSLLLRICTDNNIRENIKNLERDFLSKKINEQEDRILIDGAKELSAEIVNAELSAVDKVLGEKSGFEQVKSMYLHVIKLLDLNPESQDTLLKPTVNIKKELSEALKELNCFRCCFRTVLDKLVIVNDLSEMTSTIEWYDVILNNLKSQRQQMDEKKTMYEEVDKIVSKSGVFSEYLSSLKKEVFDRIDSLTTVSRKLVNEVMGLFLMSDEEMTLEFNKNTGEFKMNITLKADDNHEILTPEKYLNTFRYKLFCMTLKMAIAFAVKKFYQINFPIVIDDVFYSSDFIHRGMVQDYFELLFEKHRELNLDKELQVIFLTHDDILVEAAYRGICGVTECTLVDRQMIFDYREADPPVDVDVPYITEGGELKVSKIKMIKIAYS